MHTMDIPFVMNNVDIAKSEVGEGQEQRALADAMSGAWAAFARTGNPNHKGLPLWPPFDGARRATMIFNNESRAVDNPYREERAALRDGRQP